MEPQLLKPKLYVVSLWAEDVPQTAHFYRDVIGLRSLPQHGSRPHFDLGQCILVILQGKPLPAQNPIPARFPVMAFSVANLDINITKLHAHKIELPWGIEQDEQGRWVMFHDPGGNLIELVQSTL